MSDPTLVRPLSDRGFVFGQQRVDDAGEAAVVGDELHRQKRRAVLIVVEVEVVDGQHTGVIELAADARLHLKARQGLVVEVDVDLLDGHLAQQLGIGGAHDFAMPLITHGDEDDG